MTVLTAPPMAIPERRPTTGPDLLRRAAELLPSVVHRGQTSSTNIHVALYQAAMQMRGCNAAAAHQLAGEAVDMFASYLADLHDLQGKSMYAKREAMRTWAFLRSVGAIEFALRAAAEHWRAELILSTLAPAGGDQR